MRLRFLIAAMTMLIATPALAQVTTFAKASGWEAFGGLATNKKKVCGVSLSSAGSFFSLKYFQGDKVLTVQLSDEDWTGKVGDKQDVKMYFDKGTPWTASATTIKLAGDIGLEFSVSADNIDDWFDDFKQSYVLKIDFVGSRVKGWVADLTGTKRIGEAMEECVDALM